MKPVRDSIVNFLKEERETLSTDESNYFALVIGEIAKYYEYLMVIWPRYEAISKTYVQAARKQMERNKAQSSIRNLSAEEVKELDLSRQRQTELHLELESIFIFCSIFLDRIAASTQYFFGPGSKKWGSFESMKDHFEGYCINKGLSTPSKEILQTMQWLHKNVCEFRHALVVHKHDNDYRIRLSFGTSYSNDKNDFESYFNLGLMYPKGSEQLLISEKPSNILNHLNNFIELWLNYIKANSNKRNLSQGA